MSVIINGRFLNKRITGVQRYGHSLAEKLKYNVAPCNFPSIMSQAWEQLILPFIAKNHLLFSPCNVGPVFKKKQVVTIHDVAFLDHPEWFSKKFSLVYKLLVSMVAKNCLHIITDSRFSKERIQFHFKLPADKVSVVYCGVSESFFPKEKESCHSARERLGLSNDKIILSVGSVDPRKNVFRLLKVWNSIPKNTRNGWKLVLAGGKSNNFAKTENVQETVDIKHLGYVSEDDLHALYSLADIFVYPSLYEGFGLPPLEAMSCNTAVLTSNITSLPEVVGDAAYLVDPYSEASILQGLTHLMTFSSLRNNLAVKGLAQSKKFSWDKCAKEVNDILMRFE